MATVPISTLKTRLTPQAAELGRTWYPQPPPSFLLAQMKPCGFAIYRRCSPWIARQTRTLSATAAHRMRKHYIVATSASGIRCYACLAAMATTDFSLFIVFDHGRLAQSLTLRYLHHTNEALCCTSVITGTLVPDWHSVQPRLSTSVSWTQTASTTLQSPIVNVLISFTGFSCSNIGCFRPPKIGLRLLILSGCSGSTRR